MDYRKHRATGKKPPGGARKGAGRPVGVVEALERGEVAAIRALNLRVPPGADPVAAAVANEAFGTLVDIMRGLVRGPDAALRRSSAKDIREEICGPVAQKVNLADANGEKLTVAVNIVRNVAQERLPQEEPVSRRLPFVAEEFAGPEEDFEEAPEADGDGAA